MSFERLACISFCVVTTSAVVAGQQRADTPTQGSTTSVIERTYSGGIEPWREVETRTDSGNREVVVNIVEFPNLDGKLAPIQQTVEETLRTGPNTEQTRRDVIGFLGSPKGTLMERTESLRETAANGDASGVQNTWVPDLNGRLDLMARQIEQTRSAGSGVRQTDTTVLVPTPNEPLRETDRTEYTERRINPGAIQRDNTVMVRDINGRWQSIEIRRGEARAVGASEQMEEETVQRVDMNRKLSVAERNVTRRSRTNEQDEEVTETYGVYADGSTRSDGQLVLSQRVRRTTTPTADGGRYTVEEMEGRSFVAPSDPMRVMSRTVTTVRPVGAGRWITERQVFERDVNGRMHLIFNDAEAQTGR